MTATPHPGTEGLTEDQRRAALDRFQILRPHLEEGVPLARIAQEHHLGVRTLSRWAAHYRQFGLAGLCRKPRSDRDQRKMSPTLQQFIEGLALHRPHLSSAGVHREAALLAARLGEPVPSYRTVHMVIRDLAPALVTLAHDGAKAYGDAFDLVHRTEAEGPNALWQADHSELDLFVRDGSGKPRKPWLTVILDDYSRAVAGYALYLADPSTIQT
jgi:putative transposase